MRRERSWRLKRQRRSVGGEGEFLLRDAVFFDCGLQLAGEFERGEFAA